MHYKNIHNNNIWSKCWVIPTSETAITYLGDSWVHKIFLGVFMSLVVTRFKHRLDQKGGKTRMILVSRWDVERKSFFNTNKLKIKTLLDMIVSKVELKDVENHSGFLLLAKRMRNESSYKENVWSMVTCSLHITGYLHSPAMWTLFPQDLIRCPRHATGKIFPHHPQQCSSEDSSTLYKQPS